MDFTLDKKHEMARQLFRDFAEKEVKPLAIEVDETEEFPRVTVDKMIKAGLMGFVAGGGLFNTTIEGYLLLISKPALNIIKKV